MEEGRRRGKFGEKCCNFLFYFHSNSAESTMDVLFVAILAVPLILGKFISLPELLGQVFYHKWGGRKEK